DVEDGLHFVLAVDAGSDGGQDAELPLPLRHGVAERADAVLVGRLHAVPIVLADHGGLMVAPDYARPSPALSPPGSRTYAGSFALVANKLRARRSLPQWLRVGR